MFSMIILKKGASSIRLSGTVQSMMQKSNTREVELPLCVSENSTYWDSSPRETWSPILDESGPRPIDGPFSSIKLYSHNERIAVGPALSPASSFATYPCLDFRKPKNQRSKRILKAREPKLVEVVKSCLLMRGTTTNNVMTSVLHDIVIFEFFSLDGQLQV